jgi:hypothetical protein
MMEAAGSSEMLPASYKTVWCYATEHSVIIKHMLIWANTYVHSFCLQRVMSAVDDSSDESGESQWDDDDDDDDDDDYDTGEEEEEEDENSRLLLAAKVTNLYCRQFTIYSFPLHYGPGVHSALTEMSTRNISWEVKAASA